MAALRGRENEDVAIAFVGALVPDDAELYGPAFNRAIQMFQRGLLSGLAEAALPADMILSLEPLQAFPRGTRLVGGASTFVTGEGQRVRLLPFLNVYPLKWLTVGMSVFAALVSWSWRNRRRRRLIHCVNLSMPPGLFVWLAARLTRTKVLVSVLDIFRPGALVPSTFARRFDFALHRWLLPRFDGLTVISKAVVDDFAPGRSVCLLEGGVSPQVFRGARHSQQERTGAFRVVLAGSLDRHNGVEVALASLSYLPDGYELVFAGTGGLAEKVRQCAAQDPRIVHCGFLSFEDVLALYWSVDLLLNIRLTQALDTRYFFPSKLMELLASGTPVLSTCTGHVEEEYGHVLYLLRDETPEALAERIMQIASLPAAERNALGRRARDFMLAHKTWNKQGERLARYIRAEVLGRTKAAGASSPVRRHAERPRQAEK